MNCVGKIKPPYDLDDRTYEFAKHVRQLVKKLSPGTATFEDGRQAIRASGSVAANYIEASDAISEKDKLHRMKLCRKESKESQLWLRLLDVYDDAALIADRKALVQEALELTRIFASIVLDKEGKRANKK